MVVRNWEFPDEYLKIHNKWMIQHRTANHALNYNIYRKQTTKISYMNDIKHSSKCLQLIEISFSNE